MYDCRMASGKIQSWASIKFITILNIGAKLFGYVECSGKQGFVTRIININSK